MVDDTFCHDVDIVRIKQVFERVYNDNSTERSPIQSVIIRVINKIGRPRSGSPISLIARMITYRIGRHEALVQINRNHYNFRENKCIPFFVKSF